MVSPPTLLVFAVAAFTLVIVPGPNNLYITARGMAQGRTAAVVSAVGVETGTLVHIGAAAAGLSYLIARSATAFAVVKWVGAAYLVYLGIRTLLAERGAAAGVPAAQPLRRVFLEGVVVNVLNPKVILFFLAFLPQFVDPAAGSAALQIVVLGVVLLVLGILADMVYAVGAGTLSRLLRGGGRPLRYVSGCVYLGLGVATALTGGAGRTR
ncbi:LysE family translocator [Sphaerisporangium sp. TRM90804]|uniref:LysE family translocator n=1 Tax=Sphaerisporangium sp. TRM90804 TaxID=3031113 RepID=UPI00244A0A4D|nr:LysE family translocator [Sphaerisporangium sp. TRM90804]MDH2427960.1 LysE family translocator [Sphaerisporangium sp. TRM90804]